MTSWNEQDRTRSFLAAALVTAVCGAIFSTTDATPRLSASSGGARADLSRPAAVSFAGDDASSPIDPLVSEVSPIAGADERAEMRDSVASPSLSPSLAAGPAGASGAWTAAARAAASPGGASPADAAARLAAARLASTKASAPRNLRSASGARRADSFSGSNGSSASLDGRAPRAPGRGIGSRGFSDPPARGAADPSRQLPFSTEAGEALGARAVSDAGSATGTSQGAAKASRAVKTPNLAKLLGPKPLRPPRGAVRAPSINPWKGHPAPRGLRPLTDREAEEIAAPLSEKRGEKLSGARHEDGWGWLERSGESVWLWPSPEGPALLAHEGHWWWQSRGVWFLLHDGQPWGWRYLSQWKKEGLVSAAGVQMVYSDDGRRVGIVAPGAGAVLYDSTTGAELGRWSAEQLPAARPGKAPSRLRLP